jgi:hypothetical protein
MRRAVNAIEAEGMPKSRGFVFEKFNISTKVTGELDFRSSIP